ncbi:hypothetical protein C4G99_RS17485 [Vibrio parahaemolyticus]|nr:hypothetical protein [Vibrio parahaemolyticus]EJG1046805.1 hypothetical protein [Vibrio parahaemolyticus]EJG1081777.1 hypothetical protein [Vibrio parahaemolyticus]EJG1095340.1 hypothetical protein [Vibrio parahaemolyticus]
MKETMYEKVFLKERLEVFYEIKSLVDSDDTHSENNLMNNLEKGNKNEQRNRKEK